MNDFHNSQEELCNFAMRLFSESGNAVTHSAIFENHTPEQVAYFDTDIQLSLSKAERDCFNVAGCVSHLFDIEENVFDKGGSVCFYSAEIYTSASSRSQTAYDLHLVLAPALSSEVSVFLFRHEDKVMLSMKAYDSDVYLSDWYDESVDYDKLIEKLDVANFSLLSAKDYFEDLVYIAARWYYIYPITKEIATYYMMPINYVEQMEYGENSIGFDRDTLKEQVRNNFMTAELEYGDDFVEQRSTVRKAVNIGAELDVLALELEMEERENPDSVDFDDDFGDNFGDGSSDYFEDDTEKDEYEFADFDDRIFDDPTLMVKFLERSTTKNEEEQFILPRKNDNQIPLADFFREFNLEVIDKRPQGGCLWVVGSKDELQEYIEFAEEEYGVTGNFSTGKAIQQRYGWFTTSNK